MTVTMIEEQPGEVYVIVVTQGEYSNKRMYVLEWFAVYAFATERAADLAKLDVHWTKVWHARTMSDIAKLDVLLHPNPRMDRSGTFFDDYEHEEATLAAARLAMRDPRWEAVVNSTLPTRYDVQAIRCGADTFESLERTAGSLMKALTLLPR